jgi:mRNA interferase MazF
MANQYKYGDVLLVTYPFTDQSAAKQRPVLVISQTRFNQGQDIIVLPLSSRVDVGDPFGFPIYESDAFFRNTGLRVSSSVKWSKPMTISSVVVTRKLGVVPAETMRQLAEKLQGLFTPPTTADE